MLNAGWDLRHETSPLVQQQCRVAFDRTRAGDLTLTLQFGNAAFGFLSCNYGRFQLAEGLRHLAQSVVAILECLPRRVKLKPEIVAFIHKGVVLRLCSPMLALPRMAKATERPRWPQALPCLALPCLALPVVSGSSWSLALGPWTLAPWGARRSSLWLWTLVRETRSR